MTDSAEKFTSLALHTAYGLVYRQVSLNPPRNGTAEEIPIIDLSGVYGDLSTQGELVSQMKAAAENTGFFYIKNHGISKEIIEGARDQALGFFRNQTAEVKESLSKKNFKYYNGYSGPRSAQASPSESPDNRESFSWRYSPEYDPETKDLSAIPPEVKPFLQNEEGVWDGTAHIPGFKDATIKYWQACLILARRLVKAFALSFDLPEDYFDSVTTYPGSDGVYNFYPAMTPEEAALTLPTDVGLGSHTDLQCFTLLWQDMTGGLQVLKNDGQWIKAQPIQDTIVVNIGDYLMRLSNDRFKSTVHRVFNRTTVDRLSMPFFFGFNFNEKCGVLPSCTDENNPAKYEPVSCGEWTQRRFRIVDIEKTAEEENITPLATMITV